LVGNAKGVGCTAYNAVFLPQDVVYRHLGQPAVLALGARRKEGWLEPQGERLLQDLVSQEKDLAAKVEEARGRAEATIVEAETEARRILEQARAKVDELVAQRAESAAKEAEAARDEIVRAARETAARLEAEARAAKDDAVSLVMERVLP